MTLNIAPQNAITKVTQIIRRPDGSEVKICVQAMFGAGLSRSIDVHVHRRDSAEHNWKLCNDRPSRNWRTMSVDDYINNGRSEMLRAVSYGEILKLTAMLT